MPKATGKDHARINLDIWGDEPYMDLTPPAQHLYFVLWTSPQLSYCGAGEWHPGKIAARARGWTAAAVSDAGAELSRELFLVVDTDTDEFVLRSWVKHDGLWRVPNMAVSMANARAELASRILRGVVVHEVKKLQQAEPDLSGWKRDAVVALLKQRAVDPADLQPYTPPNRGSNPSVNPAVNPSAKGYANPSTNPNANPGNTPTPAPTSLTPTPTEGYVSRERHQGTHGHPPSKRCPDHMNDPTPPDCGRCADARRARQNWDTEQQSTREAEAQAAYEAQQAAIHDCAICDEDGRRPNGLVCDHIDRTEIVRAGRQAVAAALKGGR